MPTRRGRGQTSSSPGASGSEDRIKCLQKVWKLFESKFYLPAASRGNVPGKLEGNGRSLKRLSQSFRLIK
mgnify:CR=1 FL=1